MYGEKACALIKEISNNPDTLLPYNSELIDEVSKEIKQQIKENQEDVKVTEETRDSGGVSMVATVRIRHAAVKRNVRCLISYHYNRLRCLRTMRWEFGSMLPADIKANLSQPEAEWFSQYSRILVKYMKSLTDEGVNLTADFKPPKALYIEVRCLVDYGRFEMSDGSTLLLKKHSRHYLPRNECEELLRLGVFQHIMY